MPICPMIPLCVALGTGVIMVKLVAFIAGAPVPMGATPATDVVIVPLLYGAAATGMLATAVGEIAGAEVAAPGTGLSSMHPQTVVVTVVPFAWT